MAGRIEGITIKIGANTTELQAALKGVDGRIKGLQSGLKDANKLLRFNPTSTTLLTQKQQMLRKAIDETNGRLRTLKEAQKQMDDKGVDKQSDQYQRLQREIADTEEQLRYLEREYSKVASVAGVQLQVVGDKMQQIGQKISEVGSALTRNLTAPIAGVAAVAISSFQSVDRGMDTVVAKTGATGEALESMKEIAKSLATEIPTDFETAGAAVGEVATRFKLSGDELDALSGQFIKFAKLNKTDVATSVDLAQSAMAAFGLSADQAGAYLDTLNAVGQRTGADVNKLSQEMTTNAASLKELGFNASDAANFLGNLSVNGIDTAQVMSGLKKAFVEATQDGKTMREKLAELQDTMANADSNTEAYAAVLEVFGNRAGPALASVIREGRLSLEQLGTSIDDNIGNVDQTFENTLDPIDEFKMALNEAKLAGAELGKEILTRVKPFIEKAQKAIKDITKRFKEMSPAQKDAAIKAAALAAALGPVLVIAGKLVSGIGAVTKGIGKLMTAIASIAAGTAGAATLAGLAAAAVALGGALYIAHQRTKEAVQAQHGLTEEQQKVIETLNASTEAYNQVDQARREATESVMSDAQYSHQLVDEYNSLIDANGKVKEGYENRAEFIKTQLAESLGVEKGKIDELIGANGQLDASIHQLIETKKAEAILDANKDAYTAAVKERQTAVEKLGPALRTLQEQEQKVADAEANVAQKQQELDNYVESGGRNLGSYKARLDNAKIALEGANSEYDKAKSAVDGYSEALSNANQTIAGYEGLAEAIAAKDTAAMEQWLSSITNGLKTRENATRQELEAQAQAVQEEYELIKAAYESGNSAVTEDMVAAAKARADAAAQEAGSVTASAQQENAAISTNTKQASDAASINSDTARKNVSRNTSRAAEDAERSYKRMYASANTESGAMERALTTATDAIKRKFPINLGQLFTGTLTTITAKIKDAAGEKSVKYTTGVQRFAKAYQNPYIFTTPTLLGGNRLVGDRGSANGGEMVYGRDNLMRDIAEATNQISATELYQIITAALDNADMKVNISGREFARLVREV